MPGPGDLDRKVAIKYGFRAHNLIGVDKNIKLCRDLRKRNVTMIHGDAVEVLAAWKPESLPDVILLDTCSSVSMHFTKLFSVFRAGNFCNRKMVWGINLVHGRDSALNMWRSMLFEDLPQFGDFVYNPKRNLSADMSLLHGGVDKNGMPGTNMHRGLAAAFHIAETFISDVLKRPDGDMVTMYKVIHSMDMEFDQYRSDNATQTMDSVIFNWSQFILNKNNLSETVSPKRIRGYNKKVSHKIAAGLATGTISQKRKA